MNSSVKMSVIMPVYNAEKCLRRAVDCIIAQSLREWELILIDDGSTDSSSVICNEYANCDSRICVIHKKNEGVSAARQLGLDLAKGDYIIHADSDDWCEKNMLESLYSKAIENDNDVVICDYYTNNGRHQELKKQEPSDLSPNTILRELFQQLHGSCCNKIIKKSYYKKHSISFLKGIDYCEDLLFWCQIYIHEDVKTSYLPEAFYHYTTESETSITRSGSLKLFHDACAVIDKLNEIYPNDDTKKHILQRQKMQVKHYAFTHPQLFSSRDYRFIYPEANNGIKLWNTSIVNKCLMRLSLVPGLYYICSKLYSLKNRITGHTVY